jgi:hypothetical protein
VYSVPVLFLCFLHEYKNIKIFTCFHLQAVYVIIRPCSATFCFLCKSRVVRVTIERRPQTIVESRQIHSSFPLFVSLHAQTDCKIQALCRYGLFSAKNGCRVLKLENFRYAPLSYQFINSTPVINLRQSQMLWAALTFTEWL